MSGGDAILNKVEGLYKSCGNEGVRDTFNLGNEALSAYFISFNSSNKGRIFFHDGPTTRKKPVVVSVDNRFCLYKEKEEVVNEGGKV